jgi:hypothetical protein
VPDNILQSSFSLDKQEATESFSMRRSVFAQSSSSFSTSIGGETRGVVTRSLQTMHQNGNLPPVQVTFIHLFKNYKATIPTSDTNSEGGRDSSGQPRAYLVPKEKESDGAALYYTSQWKNCRSGSRHIIGRHHRWYIFLENHTPKKQLKYNYRTSNANRVLAQEWPRTARKVRRDI